MADFKKSLELVLKHEGGYVCDPSDPGGETYKGVARNMHSGWVGWQEIDLAKKEPGFPANLDRKTSLTERIEDFYRVNFWSKIKGDDINNEVVAQAIFDFAVNAGTSTSASLAQKIAGVAADGVIGPASVTAINNVDPELFIASFTVLKIARYIAIVKKRPESKKYFYGWVCRALNC